MTHTLTTLLDLDATTEDGRFPVRALFHDPASRAISHVALDIGSWMNSQEVLITADRFDAPGETEWPLNLSRDELDSAPEWTSGGSIWSDLPPLVVGPFGYTFSPMLMAAGLGTSARRGMAEPPSGTLHGPEGTMRSADLLGREVFGPGGRLGTVEDVGLDGLTLTTLILDDGTAKPIDEARNDPAQGYFVFD